MGCTSSRDTLPGRVLVQDLRRELLELKTAMPKLALAFPDGANRLQADVFDKNPLADDELARKRKFIRLAHPIQDRGDRQSYMQAAALDEFHKKYDVWLVEMDRYEKLQARTVRLDLRISNEGTSPATEVEIKLALPDGLTWCTKEEYPKPPPQPKPSRLPASVMKHLLGFSPPILRSDLEKVLANVSAATITRVSGCQVEFSVKIVKHEHTESLHSVYVVFDDPSNAK